MFIKNLTELKAIIRRLSFDAILREQSFLSLLKGPSVKSFSITTRFGYDIDFEPFESTLYFEETSNAGIFELIKYTCKHRSVSSTGPSRTHTFLPIPWHFTQKEAYNLLDGRAVYRFNITLPRNDFFTGWLELNFNEQDELGNYKMRKIGIFNLESALKKLNIYEIEEDEFNYKILLRSLRMGNLHLATLVQGTRKHAKLLCANPQFKLIAVHPIKIYDKEFVNSDRFRNWLHGRWSS